MLPVFSGSWIDSLQNVHVPPVLGNLELDEALQMGLTSAEQREIISYLLAALFLTQPRRLVTFAARTRY